MKNLVLTSALAGVLSVAAAVDANAWTRTGAVYGPRGVTTFGKSGSCAGGQCAWQGHVTGPRGYTTTGQGSASCGGGACTVNRSATGPRGRTYSSTVTYAR